MTANEAALAGKVAIVTGGSSGIGRATCRSLADAGVQLVVVGMNRERIDQTVTDIGGDMRHLGLALDVSAECDMRTMTELVLDRFGRIDVLVASAGILRPPGEAPKPLSRVTVDEWDRVINTNLRGVFLSNRAVLPTMIDQGIGTIVNISSVSGLHGRAYDAPYCASKFGIIGLSESLAEEVRNRGVKVEVLVPDAVSTPIWQQNGPVPMPEMAMPPEHVAALILFTLAGSSEAWLPTTVIAPTATRPTRERASAPKSQG